MCWWSLTAWLHCAIFCYKITATIQFSLSRPPFSLFFFFCFSSANDMMTYRNLMEKPGAPGKWNCPASLTAVYPYTFDYKTATHLSIYIHVDFLYSACVVLFFLEGRLYIVSIVNVHSYSDINCQWYYSFYSQSWWYFFVFVFLLSKCRERERKNPIK